MRPPISERGSWGGLPGGHEATGNAGRVLICQTMAPLSGAFPTATQRSYHQARIAHSSGLLNLHAYTGHQRDQRHDMFLIRSSRRLALLSLHLECVATILIMLAEFDKSAERTARDPFTGFFAFRSTQSPKRVRLCEREHNQDFEAHSSEFVIFVVYMLR